MNDHDHDACLSMPLIICSNTLLYSFFHNSLMKNMMIIEINMAATIPKITFILMFFHLKLHIIRNIWVELLSVSFHVPGLFKEIELPHLASFFSSVISSAI